MNTAVLKLTIAIKNIKWALSSIFWKKDSSVVIFGSWFGKKFADNPRFLFEYLSENKDRLGLSHVVWITRSEEVLKTVRELGYEAYLLDSLESIKYHKIAKYHIANNAPASNDKNYKSELFNQFSFRAHKINLWHGVAVVKGISFDSNDYLIKRKKHTFIYSVKESFRKNSSFYRKFFEYEGGWGDCYFVAPSVAEMDKMFRSHMLPEKRFIITGYARNCPCPKLTKEEEAVIDIIKSYKTSIIYMLTFRTGDN
ncbi:MAG: CDP-glycerol glycerophosphotransferase family protein, partial [Lachnospiraceae bacterium]|nr:CDP-glycerol glycerophosphotransferase family protein [Lachnospiraceae bacterium]